MSYPGTLSNITSFPQANQGPFNDLVANPLTPAFQVDFVYGVNTQLGTTSVVTTGGATTASRLLVLSTGVGAAGSGVYASRRPSSYRPGQGTIARFTPIFTAGVAASEQFAGVANMSTVDAVGFGFDGTAFGLLHRNGGSSSWVAQADWNGDKCNGSGASGMTWIPTNGNVVQVLVPYLGFGNITYWVENPTTSAWILVHTIRYTNTTTATEFANPSLHFTAYATNSGNTSNVVVKVGSVGIFTVGIRGFLGAKWGAAHIKTSFTTQVNVLSLRNATTYNGVDNQQLLRLRSISTAYTNAVNGICTIRLNLGATVGGTPAFAPISGTTADNGVTITSGQSSASVDTAGTTITGGTILQVMMVNNQTGYFADLTPFEIFVGPGETLTVAATNSVSGDVGLAVTWDESN